ncbi:hypothetical protein [Xanthocytophaga agilis]|uniref:DUF3857 domain-containing protein n=1 Tax=Xanthocytophaga agilis TaxID=3048010 RepID=A0AAE3UCH6_9BACT|nr:hypothetical protein [Xanthocytophaga agilis]MDJ1500100.1 hypothetical protein [Xanthocytophaga agilis]
MFKIQQFIIGTLCLVCSFTSWGQTQDKIRQIKEKMWALSDPGFKSTEVPDKWKNESAVILCRSMEYQVKKEVFIIALYENVYSRQRIKLQDAAAVKEYSELSFPASRREMSGVTTIASLSVYVGIKVIKSNGTIKDIDMKESVVMEAKQGYEKEQYNKIAVPDLEPGDIIDYYYCLEKTTAWDSFGRVLYSLAGKYPIVKQRLDINVMRKCHISAKSMNGAPELKRNLEFKDNEVYSLLDENREKVNSDQHWFYTNRSVPSVNFRAYYIQSRKSGWEEFFVGDREEVYSNISSEKVLGYINMISTLKKKYYPWSAAINSFWSRNNRKEKDAETLSREAYYYLRQRTHAARMEDELLYNSKVNYGINNANLMLDFSYALKKKKVDHDLILVTSRQACDLKDLIVRDDISYMIRINTPKPFFISNFNEYSYYNEINPLFEGATAYSVNMLKKASERTIEKIVIPATSNEINREQTDLFVSIDPEQEGKVHIKRSVLSKGLCRFAEIRTLVTSYEYLYDSKPEKYSIILVEKQDVSKRVRESNAAKVAQRKDQDQKERLETMKKEVERDFSAKVTSYDKFELLQTGSWDDKPELKFQDEFTLEGILTNNGPNYLLDAGKLISQQIDLQKEEMDRKDDIYMPYARSFVYTITVAIPKGYEVKGLENFNSSVTNTAGGFVSSASVSDGKLSISVKKYYTHNYEKASSWPDMVAFLEAAYHFTQQKILIRKIQSS